MALHTYLVFRWREPTAKEIRRLHWRLNRVRKHLISYQILEASIVLKISPWASFRDGLFSKLLLQTHEGGFFQDGFLLEIKSSGLFEVLR